MAIEVRINLTFQCVMAFFARATAFLFHESGLHFSYNLGCWGPPLTGFLIYRMAPSPQESPFHVTVLGLSTLVVGQSSNKFPSSFSEELNSTLLYPTCHALKHVLINVCANFQSMLTNGSLIHVI